MLDIACFRPLGCQIEALLNCYGVVTPESGVALDPGVVPPELPGRLGIVTHTQADVRIPCV